MDISVRQQGEVHVVQMQGDIKVGPAVDSLRQTFVNLMEHGSFKLVINLTGVNMIDSSGIGVLVRTMTQSKHHQGNLKLVNPSNYAQQTLKTVGLISLFEIFNDEKQAVESYH